ncbi:MAG: ACT domain-containing protein [bacterium]|nr:ACT domain-containing protein [bacterium]
MPHTVKKIDVWAGDVLNRPGMLARVLESLTQAGTQLEFMVARRVTEQSSRLFVAPVKGKKQQQAAADVGLVPATGMHSIRVDGPDRAGLGAEISRAVASAGINIRGASAATIGRKNVFYLAFKTSDEAAAAAKVVRKALAPSKRKTAKS